MKLFNKDQVSMYRLGDEQDGICLGSIDKWKKEDLFAYRLAKVAQDEISLGMIGAGKKEDVFTMHRLGGVEFTQFGGRFCYAARFFTECSSSNSMGLL